LSLPGFAAAAACRSLKVLTGESAATNRAKGNSVMIET
jgi:hypothetical protein